MAVFDPRHLEVRVPHALSGPARVPLTLSAFAQLARTRVAKEAARWLSTPPPTEP